MRVSGTKRLHHVSYLSMATEENGRGIKKSLNKLAPAAAAASPPPPAAATAPAVAGHELIATNLLEKDLRL